MAAVVRTETVVTRSRFITTLAPAVDREAADAVVAAARGEFHDAGHHCTAMVFGPNGQRERSNDDGEPAGTAGGAVTAAVERATRLARRPVARFELSAAHEDAGRLEHWLRTWAETHDRLGADTISPGTYDASGARFALAVPLPRVPALRAELASSGISHHLEDRGREIRAVPD
ncbi:MAG: YigZ family protein [Nitriliruptor sp.]|nr:MAG: YigZ family protein [Nitriliruptor sp.]